MLFLPSDPDAFPTGPLRKIEPEKPVPPSPKDTWKEVKPGIFQNGLGEMKTGDMRPKLEDTPKKVHIVFSSGPAYTYKIIDYSALMADLTRRQGKDVISWSFL